ncbi:hypothetical protein ROP_pKNR02-00020 (plasmid) [Rhodococcus opacus B4]|uniref:Helix-turn-helix domain-containing protein n=1 Tax=Rhodococcus opacus (strain B4) TaxID=632772 RepID=Q564M7_RHOOB|nr:hypothetical protein ROP_pKNR02-00020 [Rhodococcus opacus B4]
MPASPPSNNPSSGTPASMPGRPRWSASEAARRCGVGRSTIQRALVAGRIPDAVETEKGWSIPLDGLLAAGFTPDRPSPPDPTLTSPPNPARGHDRAPTNNDGEHARRIAELELALERERARAELEHARRVAAEQLAAERAERVADLRHTLRMIEAPLAEQLHGAPEESPVEPPVAPATSTEQAPTLFGLLGRLLNR